MTNTEAPQTATRQVAVLVGIMLACAANASWAYPGQTCSSALLVGSVPYSNIQPAHPDYDPMPHGSCAGSGQVEGPVWYRFTPVSSATVYISSRASAVYSTALAVYVGSCAGLTEIACVPDYFETPNQGDLALSVTAGTTYYLRLSVYAGLEGREGIHITTAPIPHVCGDGYIEAGEQCDDGNNIDSDGCTNQCIKGSCALSCSGEPSVCIPAADGSSCGGPCAICQTGACISQCVCGDGIVIAGGEDCDDGNTSAGDGCSDVCVVENCHVCSGAPSTCPASPDGTVCSDGEGCSQNDTCTAGHCGGTEVCLARLCPGAPDPCVVSGKITLPAGSNVDLGARALHFKAPATVNVETEPNGLGGGLRLSNTARIDMDPRTTINANGKASSGGYLIMSSSGPCALNGAINLRGRTAVYDGEAVGGDGGELAVDCVGIDIGSTARVTASASPSDTAGGSVTLEARTGNLNIADKAKFDLRGRGVSGGIIDLHGSGQCNLGATVTAPGGVGASNDGEPGELGTGGILSLQCDGSITLTPKAKLLLGKTAAARAGKLTLSANGGQLTLQEGSKVIDNGTAGNIALSAQQACSLASDIRIASRMSQGPSIAIDCADISFTEPFKLTDTAVAADASDFFATATGSCRVDGSLLLRGKAGTIPASQGGGADIGSGGGMIFTCPAGFSLSSTGTIDISGTGSADGSRSNAGSLTVTAASGAVTIDGLVNGKGTGAAAAISLAGADGVTLNASIEATGSEQGGSIELLGAPPPAAPTGDITINGKLSVSGLNGAIRAEGCDLTVAPQASLANSGPDGNQNTLIAHRSLSVGGKVTATDKQLPATAANTLSYRDSANVTGTLTPASAAVQNLTLSACP